MNGIGYKLTLPPSEKEKLDELAASFPEKVQKRIFNKAQQKAAQALANRVQTRVPLGKRKRYMGPLRAAHARDTVAYSKARHYKSGTTLTLVGYASRENPLQTLLERGNFLTSPRMTRHESNSGRIRVNAGTIRKRRTVKTASGRYRTTYDIVNKTNRRSTGSRYVGSGTAMSRGDFPKTRKPYAPLTKSYKEMRGIVAQIMFSEVKAGLDRELARGWGI